jgi:ribokinase
VFNGALTSALAGGMALPPAIDFAQKAAAISVTRSGAQPSAPFFEEISEFKF